MALRLKKQTAAHQDADYWKVLEIHIKKDRVAVTVGIFKDEKACRDGAVPAETAGVNLGLMSDFIKVEENPVKRAYNMIKVLPILAGAVDVLET